HAPATAHEPATLAMRTATRLPPLVRDSVPRPVPPEREHQQPAEKRQTAQHVPIAVVLVTSSLELGDHVIRNGEQRSCHRRDPHSFDGTGLSNSTLANDFFASSVRTSRLEHPRRATP